MRAVWSLFAPYALDLPGAPRLPCENSKFKCIPPIAHTLPMQLQLQLQPQLRRLGNVNYKLRFNIVQ